MLAAILLTLAQPMPPPGGWILFRRYSGASTFISVESMETEGDLRRIWQRLVYDTPQGIGFSAQFSLLEFDCGRHVVRMLAIDDRDSRGNTLERAFTPDTRPGPVSPGENDGRMFGIVCRGGDPVPPPPG